MKIVYYVLIAAVTLIVSRPVNGAETVYTLQDAYRSALQSHEDVKIAEESVFQADAVIDQAWSRVYPTVTAQTGYTQYNKSIGEGEFLFQPLGQLAAALVLSQPLYTGGRTLAALRTAQTLRETSARDLNSKKQDIALEVAAAYYNVLKAEKLIEKSRDSVERMERHKRLTEREAATRKTKANISNLLRARTLVSQARIFLTRDENTVKIARQKLRLLTMLPETAVLAEPEPQTEPQESLDELKSRALAGRDDYLASKLNIKVAEENLTLVKGAHRPQIYAQGGVQYLESHPTMITDGTIAYGGLELQVPVFEGGLTKAELSQARSKQRQAELSSQYLRRAIETQVYESYVDYLTIAAVFKSVQVQYDDAQSNFQAVESLFSQGLASSLALIDAQQALFLAERELVNASYDQQLAILRLRRSVGELEKSSSS